MERVRQRGLGHPDAERFCGLDGGDAGLAQPGHGTQGVGACGEDAGRRAEGVQQQQGEALGFAGGVGSGEQELQKLPVVDGLAPGPEKACPQVVECGVVETCTILTTVANAVVARVHNRMPVILPPGAFDPWLEGSEVPLGPWPADAMTIHPVSTLVNKPANDDPRCVEAVAVG